MTKTYQSSVEIESEHASKYLSVMCRHFGRKVPAKWDEREGKVEFPVGTASFIVNDNSTALKIICNADSEQKLEIQKSIIAGHVELFSRREVIELNWYEG
ncbi:DUF2218 domain-containing protein [Vibrio makurazakiensis]|uniref:DUF2218 domain-containing protein n=1 Tax=Vibrio makurazakiensis TaxID=2910250 RepID=UPI003D0C737A